MGEVFRALQHRLRDSTWTVVFKSLITVHLMVREGAPDVTLSYLSKHRNMLAVSMFSDGQSQLKNTDIIGRDTDPSQPRHKDETYDTMPTTSPNERVPSAIRRLTGYAQGRIGWRSCPLIRAS